MRSIIFNHPTLHITYTDNQGRESDQTVRATFCVMPGGEENETHVGVAWCAPQDNFSFEEGRRRATERLVNYLALGTEEGAFSFTSNTEDKDEFWVEVFEKARHFVCPSRWTPKSIETKKLAFVFPS